MAKKTKRTRRQRVKRGIRGKINGTSARPRLTVYRSNQHVYAQLIDDISGHTLASASSLSVEVGEDAARTDQSKAVGQQLAERAQAAGVNKAVFDRNGYRYHGRVKALAEGAREGGLAL